MSVVTDITNHENEVGVVVLGWQTIRAWIPAYVGMTVWWQALVVRGGFETRPYEGVYAERRRATIRVAPTAGLAGFIFVGIAHVGCHRHHQS